MALIVVIASSRILLVRRASHEDHLINIWATITAVGVMLREPTIARQLERWVPGGLPTIFDVWHWTTVAAWAAGLGLFLLYEYGPVRYRAGFRSAIAFAVAIGAAFLVLSTPARSQGISIADYGGWRYGVYVGLCWALPMAVSPYISRLMLTLWRHTTTQYERVGLFILVIAAVVSGLPVIALPLFAGLGAAGIDTEFIRDGYNLASDWFASGEPQLYIGALFFVAFISPSLRAGAQLMRLRQLRPLWRELTAAAPEVVLVLRWNDRWNRGPAERLNRRHIEIGDAAKVIARYTRPLPIAVEELLTTTIDETERKSMSEVAALVIAAQRLDSGDGSSTAPPNNHRPVAPDVDVLLRFWAPARSLLCSAPSATHGVVSETS
ncbi:hypothetical protein OG203_45760 [Nocardia sp. NBC_01499]|uniref:DUF6545 domain-containing protein n=1 Tax=Nocardia sp. NBC_01499 TaxID=2903597 RepID=UPI00386DB3D0